MTVAYHKHEFEKDLLKILGLSGKGARSIDLSFSVGSLPVAVVEFILDSDELKKIIEISKEKYTFEIKSKQELIYIDNKTL